MAKKKSPTRTRTKTVVRRVYVKAKQKTGRRGRRIAGAVGGALVPRDTLGLAAGALAAAFIAPMVLDKLSFTQQPGIARTAGRFAVGVAGYHLFARVLKKPAMGQGFYVASLAQVAAEGFNIARQMFASSQVKGLAAGSMPTGDVRDPASSPALNGARGMGAGNQYVIDTNGKVLQVVN